MRPIITLSTAAACLFGIAAGYSNNGTMRTSSADQPEPPKHSEAPGSALPMAKDCDGCQRLIETIKRLIKDNNSAFVDVAKTSCRSQTRYDKDFCDGAVEREAPIIGSILQTMEIGTPSSKHFCASFLGLCDVPKVDEWKLELPSMEICSREQKTVSGKKPLQIIHFSDIHIDPLYKEGTSIECGKPICCRDNEKGTLPDPAHRAGPFGNHNCDTPMSLEQSMYAYIKSEFPDAAFALFTGDVVDHGAHNTSQKYNQDIIKHAYGAMHDHLGLVYGTAGNHEAHPVNNFEPETVSNKTHWVYEHLFNQWHHELNNSHPADFKSMGAYSTRYPKGNLRIISLNTNLYYRYNFILYQRTMERDPNGQFAWLVKELNAAEKAGENVYIMGHMPFGSSDALPNASNYFDQIVKRYSKTIKAMFFGHTHADHFQISYGNYANRFYSNALAVSYICPSLTPTSGNPAFRVYDVDPETFAVLDATTYIADLDDSGYQARGPRWRKYYSAKSAYGHALHPPVTDAAAELSPAFWHNVTEAFDKNSDLFNEYFARKSRGWKSDETCSGSCKSREICGLRAARAQDNCWVPKPQRNRFDRKGGGLYRRGGEQEQDQQHHHHHGHHDECGVPVATEWLGAFLT
ncbi:hypothetical protein E4U41_001501 [Claviceps citrina]|nr:hypothetical protein E4U41_001501 [Claviceps citrina]